MNRPFPAYRGLEPYVFVCYSHTNIELVYRELTWLNETGFRLWYDEGIKPGHEWNEDLAKAIRSCQTFLYFITPDSENSHYCRREVSFAIEVEKPIVSVHLQPTELSDGLQLSLGSIQGILRYEFAESHYRNKLAEVLKVQDNIDTTQKTNKPTPEISGIDANSIAILPFTNISGDSDDQAFSDGLAEEILNLLSRLRELKVASSTSCYFFKDKQMQVQTIGYQLGVRYVLEGTVRRAGENVRISLRLIDVETGFQVLSEKYDCVMTDIFEVQDRIAEKIVSGLKVVLSPDSQQRLKDSATGDHRAYELFLKGKGYLRESSDQDIVRKAERCFKQAIEIDARYARAHAGLCEAYLVQYSNVHASDYFDLAREASRQSIKLDPFSLDARLSLGKLYMKSGRYEDAMTELESTLKLDADNIDAKAEMARALNALERKEEAEQLIHEVIAQQPNFWRGHLLLANHHYNRGEFDLSVEPLKRVMDMSPENGTVCNNLGSANYMLGNFEEAAKAWEKSVQISPNVAAYSNTGTMHFFSKKFQRAADMYQKCIDLAPEDHRGWGNLGDAFRFMEGFEQESLSAYQRALALLESELERNPNEEESLTVHGHYLANTGDCERALKAVSDAIARFPDNANTNYYAAVVYTLLDNAEAALEKITAAINQGYPVLMVKADAQLEPLLDLDKFRELLVTKEVQC